MDLPAPLEPTSDTISPWFTCNDTSRNVCTWPRRTESSSICEHQSSSSPRYALITLRSRRISDGHAFRNLATVVQHHDPFSQLHDQRHVMFHDEYRDAHVLNATHQVHESIFSSAFSPAAGSSSMRSAAFVASARAMATSLR